MATFLAHRLRSVALMTVNFSPLTLNPSAKTWALSLKASKITVISSGLIFEELAFRFFRRKPSLCPKKLQARNFPRHYERSELVGAPD
jgi:hypothetical protein